MVNPSTLLVVKDIALSKAFYMNVLGCTVLEEHADCIKLAVGQHTVFMFEGTMNANNDEHGYHANSTLVFTVQQLDEKISELKTKGVVFIHQSPNQNKWGRYAAFKDPSGIVHELMEFHVSGDSSSNEI